LTQSSVRISTKYSS